MRILITPSIHHHNAVTVDVLTTGLEGSSRPYLKRVFSQLIQNVHIIAYLLHHSLLFAMLISSYCDDQYCHKMIISTQQGPYWRLHRKAICSNNAVVLEVLEVRMRINLSLVACPPLVTWWTYQTFPDIPDLPDLLKKWNISIRKLARLILHTVCWSLDSILLSCVFFLFFVLVLVLVLVLFSVMVLVLPTRQKRAPLH